MEARVQKDSTTNGRRRKVRLRGSCTYQLKCVFKISLSWSKFMLLLKGESCTLCLPTAEWCALTGNMKKEKFVQISSLIQLTNYSYQHYSSLEAKRQGGREEGQCKIDWSWSQNCALDLKVPMRFRVGNYLEESQVRATQRKRQWAV